MTYEELCAYLLKHPGAIKEHPLGADILAFKVNDRIFALLALQKKTIEITLKCKIEHRLLYQKYIPSMMCGTITNRTLWVTVPLEKTIPLDRLLNLIDESYEIILKSIKKSTREKLRLDRV
jgi:predicted DNA-binding protein (MmcQ/YjbR family)